MIFPWSFWSFHRDGVNNNVLLGNRYSSINGVDFSPREFIKFTPQKFEWHVGGAAAGDVTYVPIPGFQWVHHMTVKDGSTLTYYRNGVQAGTSTIGGAPNNPQPFYFGGDQTNENWNGRMDDVAVWETAVPAASVAGLFDGTYTPLTAPTDGASGLFQTELAHGPGTHYFRHRFVYSGDPARTSLSIQTLIDDGAVVYLNGVEVQRVNMPAGAVAHGTFASSEIDPVALSAPVSIPATSLVSGTNVIAVEVHQSSGASPDMAFGLALSAVEAPPGPADLSPSLALNEVSPSGASPFRVEIANLSTGAIGLAGHALFDGAGNSFALPGQALAAGDVVAFDESELGFVPVDGDRLFLGSSTGRVLDARVVTNRLRGRNPAGRWAYPTAATFGGANTFEVEDSIVINEIFYNAPGLPGVPDTQPTYDVATLLPVSATWRYNESGISLPSGWATTEHNVGGTWLSGPGLLAYEPGATPFPIGTTLTNPATQSPRPTTRYFETEFTIGVGGLAGVDEIVMNHAIDDGAIFYINGTEFERYGMPAGAVSSATFASRGGEAALVGPVAIPLQSAGRGRESPFGGSPPGLGNQQRRGHGARGAGAHAVDALCSGGAVPQLRRAVDRALQSRHRDGRSLRLGVFGWHPIRVRAGNEPRARGLHPRGRRVGGVYGGQSGCSCGGRIRRESLPQWRAAAASRCQQERRRRGAILRWWELGRVGRRRGIQPRTDGSGCGQFGARCLGGEL